MSDRELLELAVKAIGRTPHVSQSSMPGLVLDSLTYWSPLEDDGDALRLAVECDMTVCADGASTVSACSGYGRDKVMVTQTVSECGGDKSAATRRAIVRAAAKIGKRTTAREGE